MKQVSYYIKNGEDLAKCIREVRYELRYRDDDYSALLISLFATEAHEGEIPVLADELRTAFPRAQIIGSLTTHEVLNGHILSCGVALTFTAFAEAQVEVLSFDAKSLTGSEMGLAILSRLENNPDTAAVELILADGGLDKASLLKILSRSSPKIKFFGALAAEGSMGSKGRIYANGYSYASGLAAIVFRGKTLRVEVAGSFGWEPLGKCMTITKMAGDYTVQEVDNLPVTRVYEKYLGIKADGDFLEDAQAFPFYFYRHGKRLARQPRRCWADGSLTFGADLKVGEQVRLSYGNPADIIGASGKLKTQLQTFRPEALFVIGSVVRKQLLQSDARKELGLCSLAPSAGFYGYGEIMRYGREVMLSNMTLAVTAMREGSPRSELVAETPEDGPRKFSPQTNIMRHLVHFIQVSSAELEAANAKLAKLAHFDRLTNLLNRGEVEGAFSQGLSEAQEGGEPFSVLILDIDDFKGINDTYGHAVGDEALKSVAQILRDSTRRNDAPGRWGGDEFFVVLPNTPLECTAGIAERIRKCVASLQVLPGGKRITTSIGIAEARPGDTTVSLFERADQALYRAKRDCGKDCVAA